MIEWIIYLTFSLLLWEKVEGGGGVGAGGKKAEKRKGENHSKAYKKKFPLKRILNIKTGNRLKMAFFHSNRG